MSSRLLTLRSPLVVKSFHKMNQNPMDRYSEELEVLLPILDPTVLITVPALGLRAFLQISYSSTIGKLAALA